jgi:hypothetical protein
MRFCGDGEVIVTTQLHYTRKWDVSPEHPSYTPENIAAWIIRCAEADLRLAILHMQLQKESERLSEDLKIFVKEPE